MREKVPRDLQHPNRRRLLLLIDVRINIHRQPDVTMASQGLRRLGRHVRPAKVHDESMPHGVEVGVEAFGILVLVPLNLPFLAWGGRVTSVPVVSGSESPIFYRISPLFACISRNPDYYGVFRGSACKKHR